MNALSREWPHQFIRISGRDVARRGLYPRLRAGARCDDPDLHPRRRRCPSRRFRASACRLPVWLECDILGVAGASRATGPGVGVRRHDPIFTVASSIRRTVRIQRHGLQPGGAACHGACACLDGVFLAMPREVAYGGWVGCHHLRRVPRLRRRLHAACGAARIPARRGQRSGRRAPVLWQVRRGLAAPPQCGSSNGTPSFAVNAGKDTGCLSRVKFPDARCALALDRPLGAGRSTVDATSDSGLRRPVAVRSLTSIGFPGCRCPVATHRIAPRAFFAAIAPGFLPRAVRLRTLAREQALGAKHDRRDGGSSRQAAAPARRRRASATGCAARNRSQIIDLSGQNGMRPAGAWYHQQVRSGVTTSRREPFVAALAVRPRDGNPTRIRDPWTPRPENASARS